MATNPRQTKEPLETIGNRYPVATVAAVNADAERLGMSQTEWMRMAVDRALKAKVTPERAEPYRKPPTVRQLREMRRQAREADQAAGA